MAPVPETPNPAAQSFVRVPMSLSRSDRIRTDRALPHQLYDQLRPALRTFAVVAALLGFFLCTLVVLVAWIRTPEPLLYSTDPLLPRVTRGGESFHTIAPWLRTELWPALWMLLAGVAGLLGTNDHHGQSATL
jgi:hypothetical protein